jgi:hypothetical protein
MKSGQTSFKIGLQGILKRGEGPMVKLYVSEILKCKTRKMEEGMMGQSSGQFVYRGILGVVCGSRNNGSAILSPPVWEPAIKKVAKYGIGKRSVELVFTNILKFVIDIPLPGKIFSACISRNFKCCLQGMKQWKSNLEPACPGTGNLKSG